MARDLQMRLAGWFTLLLAGFILLLMTCESVLQAQDAEAGLRALQGKSAPKASPKASQVLVLVNARIHTVSGPVIDKGVLVVKGGKIAAVGPVGKVAIPKGAAVRDMGGKVIIPGLVDTHSHLGVYSRPGVKANSDGNEMTGPVQPGLRALDAINPDDPGLKMALAGGITTVNIMPGSGNAIGGQTLYVKIRGFMVRMMQVLTGRVLGGIKFANGENPKGVYGKKGAAPMTRMKIAALQRETLEKAREYKKKLDDHRAALKKGEKAVAPPRDLALEPLVEVLERRRTVHFHCHRADDILTAVRLSEEFGFELVLQHCTEGYRVAAELGRRGAWVSLTLVDSPGGKPEVMGLLEENAAILAKAGVKVTINTDDPVTESRFFLRTGAIAVRGGMTEDQALRALTLSGAEMMHLEDRLGSLDPGKDADFVVLSGAPFSVYTQVLETWVDGEMVFERTRHADWCYQAGGFAVGNRDRLPALPKLLPAPKEAPLVDMPKDAPAWKGSPKSFAVLAGRVHTVSGPALDDAVVLVQDGKIAAVGPRGKVAIPAGVPLLTARHVTPGLIDAHSVVGLSGALNFPKGDQDQDENSDPNQADLRVLDSFWPDEPLLQFIREQGVTVIHAVPGRANVIAGQTGVFRTHGRTAEQMTLQFPHALLVNLGEVPKGTYSAKVATRMGTANLLRTAFAQAQDYTRKKEGKETPPKNLKLEGLALATQGKIPVYFAAHRSDDLMTALRIAKEFEIKPILNLATEGYLIADELAKAKVPVVVHPTMQRAGSSMETLHAHVANAAVLADHKVPLTICTAFEGYVPKTRVLRFEAAMAAVNGLGHERALRSITLDAAKLLGIADRFGSIETGKIADLVLYDGDPFEHSTHVTHTLVGGRVIWDRPAYLKLPFERRALPLFSGGGGIACCLGW